MTHDPERAARLALLRQVEEGLEELFAFADAMPEPRRMVARGFLHEMVTRAASAKPAMPSAPASGTRPVAHGNLDGSKGPRCDRCKGSAIWRGGKGGCGPCLACGGSGVARQRRARR